MQHPHHPHCHHYCHHYEAGHFDQSGSLSNGERGSGTAGNCLKIFDFITLIFHLARLKGAQRAARPTSKPAASCLRCSLLAALLPSLLATFSSAVKFFKLLDPQANDHSQRVSGSSSSNTIHSLRPPSQPRAIHSGPIPSYRGQRVASQAAAS